MPIHKLTSREWQTFSKQISFSRQTIQQLSKLYIIIHEKVKSSIKKSLIDPHNNFSEQAKHHIQFIKNVIQKIKQTRNDQYLIQVDMDILRKYQNTLLQLLNQIQLMLKIQDSKLTIDLQQLKGIKPQKRQKYDLKDELLLSSKRMERTKSGKRINKKNNLEINNHRNNHQQYDNQNQIFPTMIFNQKKQTQTYQTQQNLVKKLHEKQNNIQNLFANSMSKTQSGLGVSFKKKYQQNNLQKYLRQKKQFADLLFNQQLYDKIINQRQMEKTSSSTNNTSQSFQNNILLKKGIKIDELNSKIFPQFQIKTKFMKSEVKRKVSNVITEIKKQLLNQYFDKNTQTLKQVNEDKNKFSTLDSKKRSKSMTSVIKKVQNQNILNEKIDKYKTLRDIKITKFSGYGNLSQRKEIIDTIIQSNKQDQLNIKRDKSHSSITKNQVLGKFSKTSLLNTRLSSFYQTDEWNRKTQKKYMSHIFSKIKQAKI